MTVEELLEPRYIVIAKYPGTTFVVGEILDKNSGMDLAGNFFEDFPKVFSPVAWYHHREEKDMPLYVKCLSENGKIDHVVKVEEWLRAYTNNKTLISGFMYTVNRQPDKCYPKGFDYGVRMSLQGWLPATEEEYKTFKMITG